MSDSANLGTSAPIGAVSAEVQAAIDAQIERRVLETIARLGRTPTNENVTQAVTSTPDRLAQPGTEANRVATHYSASFIAGAANDRDPRQGQSAADRYPHVDPVSLQAVFSHTLPFKDLSKLNPSYSARDISTAATLLYSNGTLATAEVSKTKAFPSFAYLIGSLSVYFDIVGFYRAATTTSWENYFTVVHGWSRFLGYLLELHNVFTFNSIVDYVERVYADRRAQFSRGSYTGYWMPDNALTHLLRQAPTPISRAQSSSRQAAGSQPLEECKNWKLGKCTSPCKWGRPHIGPAGGGINAVIPANTASVNPA
jgi:hypothetical protein